MDGRFYCVLINPKLYSDPASEGEGAGATMGWRRWFARLCTRLGEQPAGLSGAPSREVGMIGVPASALEDLSSLLVKAADQDVEIEELCSCAVRLALATGCAVIEWDSLAGESQIHGAIGTWEETPIRPILEGTKADWAFALGSAPVCASREGDTVRAARWINNGKAASGLAMPMGSEGQIRGALLFTYPTARAFTAEEVRTCRLIACHAALVMRHRALAATVERQAQRIARLVDDVERMLISLRRASSQAGRDGER